MDQPNETQAVRSGSLLAGYLVSAPAIGLVYGSELEQKVAQNYCENMKPLVSNGIALKSIYDHDGKKYVINTSPEHCK